MFSPMSVWLRKELIVKDLPKLHITLPYMLKRDQIVFKLHEQTSSFLKSVLINVPFNFLREFKQMCFLRESLFSLQFISYLFFMYWRTLLVQTELCGCMS